MHLFGDESGNPGDFGDLPDDRHFMVATATIGDDSWLSELDQLALELQQRLNVPTIGAPFHASNDRRDVVREVLTLVSERPIRVDATIIDKRQLAPEWRERHLLYAAAWESHLVHVLPQFHPQPYPVDVVVASIGTARELKTFKEGADRAVAQAEREAGTYSAVLGLGMIGRMMLDTAAMVVRGRAGSPNADRGLQIVDYCLWAIHRRWERPAEAPWAYELIAHHVASERLITLPSRN